MYLPLSGIPFVDSIRELAMMRWRTRHDSNVWPPPSEGAAEDQCGGLVDQPADRR